jgi:hypothetical protein
MVGGGVARAGAAECPGFDVPDGNRAAVDASTDIVGIDFKEDGFHLNFRVDAQDIGDYQVTGYITLKIHTKRGIASGCFKFAPRDFATPGPYYLPVKVTGGPGGKLPHGVYYAKVELAVAVGDRLYRDSDQGNNVSEFETEYGADLEVRSDKVSGEVGESAGASFLAINHGSRETGPLIIKWITGDETTTEEKASIDAESEVFFGRDFQKAGETIRLIVYDESETVLDDSEADVPGGEDPEDPDGPDSEDPEDPEEPEQPNEGIDYMVSKVYVEPMGEYVYQLASSVKNVGKEAGGDTVGLKWSLPNLGVGALKVDQTSVAPIKPGEETKVVAVLDLSGYSANSRPERVSGSLRVGDQVGEDETGNNAVEFSYEVGESDDEIPTPPRFELVEFDARIEPPVDSESEGVLILTFQVRNNGGQATHFSWGVTGDYQSSMDLFRGEVFGQGGAVGSGGNVIHTSMAYWIRPEAYAGSEAHSRVYRGTITLDAGIASEDPGGTNEAVRTELPFEFKVPRYEGADLAVSLIIDNVENPEEFDIKFQNTHTYVVKVTNVGKAPIPKSKAVRVNASIGGMKGVSAVQKGLAVGESFRPKWTRSINCFLVQRWKRDSATAFFKAEAVIVEGKVPEADTKNNSGVVRLVPPENSGYQDCWGDDG